MYGQTGSGKTFTIMGPKWQHMSERNSNSPDKASLYSPRGSEFSEKNPFSNRTLNREDVSNSRNSHNRSKSPAFSRSRTPVRGKRESLPISNKGESMPSTKVDLGDYKSVDSETRHRKAHTINLDNSSACAHDDSCMKDHPQNSDGLLGLALRDIFSHIENQSERRYFLKCSYLEIYNDLVFDLLKIQSRLNETLSIHEDQTVPSIQSHPSYRFSIERFLHQRRHRRNRLLLWRDPRQDSKRRRWTHRSTCPNLLFLSKSTLRLHHNEPRKQQVAHNLQIVC